MSIIVQLSPHWPSFAGIKFLIIFGDSYNSVGYDFDQRRTPSALHPLGVTFPGTTWNEEDEPNWVGHLITEFSPTPRYLRNRPVQDQDPKYLESPLLVFNYAKGGDTIEGVRRQIRHVFLPKAGKRPDWAQWESSDSLFITWVGINDCAFSSEHSGTMETFLELHDELYEAGARNFLFFDVPPIDRSPAIAKYLEGEVKNYSNWNTSLKETIQTFASRHNDITVLLFAVSETFNKILDNPKTYGFAAKDKRKAGGSIWFDHLHPTSKVHQVIAHDLSVFLSGVDAVEFSANAT
ncbi:carbohydrate esterase family 16 protein [Amanita thiersii Skay4041]|uniref:Carbohydrate esterase family 16 protein n=1 Tax=Amanita thiersii Skay4041 TaxID=703135 RepID=A0A2A9NXQ8_9AGAR|nr:carbohydrate esterase family 16 protein [Amanita thiersii Skay4041]